jgi:cardiolipin synthase
MAAAAVPTGFRWLRNGQEAFPAMLEAIDAARESIRLETYIYSDRGVGVTMRDALTRAAARGVRVRVLVDAVGSIALPATFWEPMLAVGGEFQRFNPPRFPRIGYRDHRKILVCDERVAFIGGFNIAPEYEGDGVTDGWHDLGMEVGGALAGELAEAFDAQYAQAGSGLPLQRLRRSTTKTTAAGRHWRLLLGGPGRGYNFLKRALAHDLAGARQADIICAYFLPTWRLLRELSRVPRRGGRARLILPGKTDVRLSRLAARRLYARLLKWGVELYEYQPQVLHTKLYLLDEEVYVGSANLDARSLNLNYELLVRVGEPEAVAGAREIFDATLAHCERIDAAGWRQSRSFVTRLLERAAYFVLARVDPWFSLERPTGRNASH